jgi:feruloyl esterase
MKQCDTLGEGFLNNPRQCSFDVGTLACDAGAAADSCLTPGELKTAQTFFGGLKNSKGELIFSGQAYGVPLPAFASSQQAPNPFAFDSIRILGFQNANYDWRQFDLDRDLPLVDAAAGFVDAVNPDLRAFEAHGGKLLLYAGWRDTGITPENTVLYYESVRDEMGPEQGDWLRMFLAPGMGHCRGGPGVDTFDTLTALEQWRERDVAPNEMLGRNRETGMVRPICAYPNYAKYDGSGDLKDPANFACSAPE